MADSYEHHEQVALFQWAVVAQAELPELESMFAVPNGGFRNRITAKRLKAEGVKAGVPDIFLLVPRGGYHGLAIEMKRVGGGTVAKGQKAWIKRLEVAGYLAVVCHGWIEAKDVIVDYLEGVK